MATITKEKTVKSSTDKKVVSKTTKKPVSKSVATKSVKAKETKTSEKAVSKADVMNNGKLPSLNDSKFAVVEVNGEQLIVQEGGFYEINKIEGDKGTKMELDKVLLISDGEKLDLGKPYIDGAKVSVVIDSQKKDKKLRVFKFKAKSRYRKTYGSRALITRLHVVSING